MKRALKAIVRKLGYDLVQNVEMPSCPFDVLELVVQAQLAQNGDFTFVQIGANDGVRNDPIRHIVMRHQLPGLLVEPLPDLFQRLKTNYSSHPGVSFEQCAVGEHDGHATLYRVQPDPSLPEWLQGIASFDRAHLSSARFQIDGLEKRVQPVTVPVFTLPSLLKRHQIETVTLLQVDTEGWDCRIVKSAIHSGLTPRIINYENIHCSPKERAECKRLLEQNGYRFIDVGRDTLAVLSA